MHSASTLALANTPSMTPKLRQLLNFSGVLLAVRRVISIAFIADATPAALIAHTRDRSQYGVVVDSFLNGITNYTWTNWTGPNVLFGGSAEQFYDPKLGGKTYLNKDYYTKFANKGYQIL